MGSRELGGLATVVVLTASIVSALSANAQVLVGDQFQVNSFTTGHQHFPSVSGLPTGGFVVMWTTEQSSGSDRDSDSIAARVFSSDATPAGPDFQVNSYTTGGQSWGGVKAAADGSFVVTWQSVGSPGSDNSGPSLQARRFSSSALPLGPQFQVNTTIIESGVLPSPAMSTDGRFVVAWLGIDQDGDGIRAQLFDEAAVPVGGEFVVNEVERGSQFQQAVAMADDGEYFVSWNSAGTGIKARHFSNAGIPMTEELQVDDLGSEIAAWPAVAVNGRGDFLAAWASLDPSPPSHFSVRGRFFVAPGVAAGPSFEISSEIKWDSVSGLMVDSGTNGEFLVVWSGYETGLGADVFGHEVHPLAGVVGTSFLINSETSGYQGFPSVAGTSQGEFIVAWFSEGSPGTDNDGRSIQGQRVAASTIFSDGFESGDTSRWSSTVP